MMGVLLAMDIVQCVADKEIADKYVQASVSQQKIKLGKEESQGRGDNKLQLEGLFRRWTARIIIKFPMYISGAYSGGG
jgi:hypothetical protein